jgi:hypothetical protein
VIYYQQFDLHIREGRYIPAIDESANFFMQVDPIAKACVPAADEILFDSDEYGPTLIDYNRIMYN